MLLGFLFFIFYFYSTILETSRAASTKQVLRTLVLKKKRVMKPQPQQQPYMTQLEI